MDEIIVRVARAIASLPRLRILSRLARQPEMTPKDLSGELGVALSLLSMHLRTLATAGLIQRRKSGAWCYYRAESPYAENTLSGRLAAWLASVLEAPAESADHFGLQEVRNGTGNPEALVHATIFEAATAFTDLRRLQIMRHLATQGATAAGRLAIELSMSPPALSRHAQKLLRRGYLQAREVDGRTLAYVLCPEGRTPIHARMYAIVAAAWKQKPFRTS